MARFVKRMVKIGKFEMTGPVARISDPCYERGTWCAGTVENVIEGNWTGYYDQVDEGSWGVRMSALYAFAEGRARLHDWELLPITVGVDSGQAGIFDDARYPQDPGDYEPGTFYGRACEANETDAGLIDEGVLSCSGIGDGSYPAYAVKDKEGKVYGIRILYFPDLYKDSGDFESE